jgi:hypothetical protein
MAIGLLLLMRFYPVLFNRRKIRFSECEQSLLHFLPLYNQAAQELDSFAYNLSVVEQFSQLFKG